MKLELNTKEWLAIYGLLERHANNDKHLTEVYNRMKASLVEALNTSSQVKQQVQFQTWFNINEEKVKELAARGSLRDQIVKTVGNRTSGVTHHNVLTDDDDEDNKIKVTVKPEPKKTAKAKQHRR